MEFNAQDIRDLRTHAGLTQAELAKRIGVTRVYLAQIESGIYHPTTALKNKLRDALIAAVLQKLRPMLPFNRRMDETLEVVHKIDSNDVSTQVKQRVVALRIDEPDIEPMIINGAWALYLRHHDGAQNIDLILLDEAESNLELLLWTLGVTEYDADE